MISLTFDRKTFQVSLHCILATRWLGSVT